MTKLWRISAVNPNYREWEKMMPNIQLQDARNQHLRVFSMSRTENIKTFWMYSNLKNIIEYENHEPAEWNTYLYHGCSRRNVDSIVA